MRIILSRKGFDSSPKYGRVASPIFEDGSMLSLPIPGNGMGTAYNDLRFRGTSVGRIVEDLTRSHTTGRRRIQGRQLAHHDPDLRAEARTERAPQWRALFGQVGLAQSHLLGNNVGEGDLFLFFGWFRRVIKAGKRWQFDPVAPDLHVIWGWLQVAEVLEGGKLNRSKAPGWAKYFDHFKFEDEDLQERQYNAVYVAREKLRFPGIQQDIPGAGVFSEFDPALCLTKPGQRYRSLWKLPRSFAPCNGESTMTFHSADSGRWRVRGDYCTLQTVGKGQEFVIDAKQCKGAVSWARDLLQLAKIQVK